VVALIKLSVNAQPAASVQALYCPIIVADITFVVGSPLFKPRQEKIHGQQLNPKRDLRFKRQTSQLLCGQRRRAQYKTCFAGGSIALSIFLAL
jgi:hypothetical protein